MFRGGTISDQLALLGRKVFPKTLLYYVLAAVVAILVLYPVGVLFTASVFSGQPGRWGSFTLKGYESWLGALDPAEPLSLYLHVP